MVYTIHDATTCLRLGHGVCEKGDIGTPVMNCGAGLVAIDSAFVL